METLGSPSAPQRDGWPAIASGDHTLILAPTGTGKTLAAFLWELNALIERGLEAPLPNFVQILYVSPLKALNNDVQRNLELPLAQIAERLAARGQRPPEIRIAVRTGDTPASARARMLRKAPHILITTPESLHIMLTSVRGRGMFAGVRAMIVDEIHAVAGTKRGSHLALTLERLDQLCERRPQRIGLSATQRPLDEIARFLAGRDTSGTRIVDCGLVKRMRTTIESPVADLNHVPAGTIWPSVTPLALRHIRAARTTLIFVNNRAQAEKMAVRINTLAGEELALPYHGSLSRERRQVLERSLKAGELRALVSTSSLELGIDIGSVDVVLQIQSPKRVASGLQRVGRAGHSLDAESRGVIVPTFRDDALEAVAVAAAMRDGDVEPTRIVHNALDVLAQIVVAAVSIDDDWTRDSLLALVRRAYPYSTLTDAAYDEVLDMLAGKYPADVAAEFDARLSWDRVTGRLSAPRASRMAAVISGGTIPDRGLYTVNLPDRTRIGELDEEFVHETRIGDAFQLGSSTWKVQAIEHDRVIVTPAPGVPARMPFWHGEYGARAPHLAPRVGMLRRELASAHTPADVGALMAKYDADEATVASLVTYVAEQRAATHGVPDETSLVVEQFHDETGSLRVIVHAPFGGRVNAPWGMALGNRLREWLAANRELAARPGGRRSRRGPSPTYEIQVQTTDDGIMLRLPAVAPVPLDVIRDLGADEADRRVLMEVGGSSLFGARFRMNAARALLLPRGGARRRMPLWLQRLKALDLLEAVREYPSFPILVETYRDVLTDAFDMPALRDVLRGIADGRVTMQAVATETSSPFASSLQFGFVMDWLYADDAPRAEQRAALLSLDRALLDDVLGGAAADEETLTVLDEMLARRRGTAPGSRARTADELSLLIDRAGDLSVDDVAARVATPDDGRRGDPLTELLAARRVVGLVIPSAAGKDDVRLVLAETVPRYVAAFGTGLLDSLRAGPDLAPMPATTALPDAFTRATLTTTAARHEILVRHVSLTGVVSVDDVRARYNMPARWIRARLDAWARSGRLARWTSAEPVSDSPGQPRTRYVSRRLLEQARRRELARARRAVAPVDLATYGRFLARWQHVAVDARLSGDDAGRDVMRQLIGVARPAEWWARDALRARVGAHSGDSVAGMFSSGELAWAAIPVATPSTSRLGAVRVFRRGAGRPWIPIADPPPLTADAAGVQTALDRHGASFFDDLLTITGLQSRRLRDALRELVAAGLATSDSFDALRLVARWRPMPRPSDEAPDPSRWLPTTDAAGNPIVQRRISLRRLPKWRRPDLAGAEPERWPGRWSLVHTPGAMGPEPDEADAAAIVARQWLDRYGVVSREHWRRERPAVPWRAIYREYRRLELRGEVRRGFFVDGLTGAQFAAARAVEGLRAADAASDAIVLAGGDPANPSALPLATTGDRDVVARRRGAFVAMIGGEVIVAADARGHAMRVRPGAATADVTRAARALADYLGARRSRPRDIEVATIDGTPAARSSWMPAFAEAGYRRSTSGLRYHRRI